jgi:hypothetical protein
MKSFRQILGEVAQPKPEEERAFKDMHSYETMPHPVALDHQFTGEIAGVGDATRIADQKGDAKYDTSYDDAFEYAGPSFDESVELGAKMREQADQAIVNRLSEGSAMAKSAALSKASATSKTGKDKVSLKKAPWEKNEEVELGEASASVYKDMPKAPGKMVSNRVQVKAFKDTNAMGAFLGKQNDNSWQQTGVAGLKSGKYKIDMVKKGGKPSKNFIKVNEEVELEEGFSPKQIEQLKKAYASMPDRVPMDMAKKMSAVLKGRSKEELIAIARADIKWLSTTAATNLIMQGVKAKEING